jgi:hypothetical protein
MADSPELVAHREWLGQIGQVGLVVSPNVLVKHGIGINRSRALEVQARLGELAESEKDDGEIRVNDAIAFFREVLEWRETIVAGSPGGPALPDDLVAPLPEYEDNIRPTYAVRDPSGEGSLALISVVEAEDLDKPPAADARHDGWRASPHARLERLLRATGIGIGLLFNRRSVRLVYAPHGESSGHLTFRFKYLVETQGRPMAGALAALLGVERVTDEAQDSQRLPALLRESRKYQNDVSTALAGQVLEALWQLVRGFQHANEAAKGQLLEDVMRERPAEVYGGLLTTLMRLVFILYAEDRGLMPDGEVYQRHYSIAGLFERLREDQARYPDTMDARYGAWAQLLALFRLIHDGGGHGSLRFPPRHGRLFSPDAYPFLEGRPAGTTRVIGEPVIPPQVPDGVVYRVLRNLLILDGDRLSYRALDVEQIGSVYEAMMGFALEQAAGPSLAVQPKHVVINLEELLEQPGAARAKWLRERAELTLSSASALAKASTRDEVVAALGRKVSRYTSQVLPVGALYLQPTEERRRSGSHYTPRSLTEPIVRTTFRPILERLGDDATPEQILDLKVCDPAMGSGAFLVEACRLLGDRLVRAWEVHRATPTPPDGEEPWMLARRLVAERCLYGVDKNIFAVDLAKLSLWLATLAREHPFTFLDHALRHGDSLVGLSREQIACFNWEVEKQLPLLRSLIDRRVTEAQSLREQIQGLADSDDVPRKTHLLQEAEEAVADVRLVGDLVVDSFFAREKPKERKTLRTAYAGKVQAWLAAEAGARATLREELSSIAAGLRDNSRPIPPFHWEIEFPEVFTRANAGFDVFVGNPPFMGGKRISGAFGKPHADWLTTRTLGTNGNVDLVAFFLRRAFELNVAGGTLGFVTTKTIREGDTRSGGLGWICRSGGTIFAATRRLAWPGSASVVISIIHVLKGAFVGDCVLDGKVVQTITAFLFHRGTSAEPSRLAANQGRSFIGCDIKGQGFLFDNGDPEASPLEVMTSLLSSRPANEHIIRPYMSGEDINSSSLLAPIRWVIDFGTRTLEEAQEWPELLEIVRAKVLPWRLTRSPDVASWPWWRFWRTRDDLRAATALLSRMLVTAQTGNAQAFAFLPTNIVCSHSVVVFAFEEFQAFALLQSRVHLSWATFMGPSLKDDRRYAPSDCFETFPVPTAWVDSRELEEAGTAYYMARSEWMRENDEGLTTTSNRLHDPQESHRAIIRLRELHDLMDRAVLDAYGWTDIRPRCEFILDFDDADREDEESPGRRRKPYRYRWPDEVRDEILGRLLALNSEQAHTGGGTVGRETTRRRGARAIIPLLE